MKTGKSIVELAQTLLNHRENAKDFIVPAKALQAVETGGDIGLAFNVNGNTVETAPNNWSHSQIATYADIPKPYYDRLKTENPALAVQNINHGLVRQATDRRMVRTVDGKLRALLSPKYRRLDGADLMEAVLPQLIESGMEVVSSDITERRLYLRAMTSRVQGEVQRGDVVQMGIMISTSDVGAGALRVEPFIVRLVCTNGMVMDTALKKAHLGRSLATGDDVTELLSDDTIRLGEKAFWAEVHDVVKGSLSPAMFEKHVNKLKEAAGIKIENFDLAEVVDVTCKRLGMQVTTNVKESILAKLAGGNEGAGLTMWGLANSFTAVAASDDIDFDTSVELERAGSQVINLKPSDWKVINQKRA